MAKSGMFRGRPRKRASRLTTRLLRGKANSRRRCERARRSAARASGTNDKARGSILHRRA
eukprot:5843351-Pleurochrysis_carterae.AAC.2